MYTKIFFQFVLLHIVFFSDPDREPEEILLDPQHCYLLTSPESRATVSVRTCEEPGAHGEVVPQEEDQPDGEE
jgi:hypothetical protein